MVTAIFALAMIVAAGRAAVVLPAGARIPLGGVAASGLAAGWVPGVRYVLAPAATGVLLAFEVGALLARERETSARSE